MANCLLFVVSKAARHLADDFGRLVLSRVSTGQPSSRLGRKTCVSRTEVQIEKLGRHAHRQLDLVQIKRQVQTDDSQACELFQLRERLLITGAM